MIRNVTQSEAPPQFPMPIKKGHATVKIYEVRNRDKMNYTVSYMTAANGRKRKTFADLELAKREANTIAGKLADGDLEATKLTGADRQMFVAAEQASARTGLPLDSVAREFARCFDILGHAGIVEAVRYYKKHVETGLPDVPVTVAVEKFTDAKRQEGKSANYLKDISSILGRFATNFPVNIATILPEDLRGYLNGLGISPVAKNNQRRLIVVLFNFAQAQGWLPPNEATAADVKRLGIYKVTERDVEVYTPAEVSRLLNAAGALDTAKNKAALATAIEPPPDFLPYIALIAFGGVRREELHKGLIWEAINFERGHCTIPASIAKTGHKRKNDMPENLLEWLAPYRLKRGAIFAIDPRKRIAKVVKASKVKWKRNALRHSFGSYRMEMVKNAGQVALEMGNSAKVVMDHYHKIVEDDDAKKYWAIKPLPATDRKIVTMANHRGS